MARSKKRKPRAAATTVPCPFCGEPDDVYVDPAGGSHQTYTEDCPVCCRPRIVHVEPGDEPGAFQVWLERGD